MNRVSPGQIITPLGRIAIDINEETSARVSDRY